MIELILNLDGVDGEPKNLIDRWIFEQVLLRIPGIEQREADRYFYLQSKLGMAIEIDTDEGARFGSIYLSASSENLPEARNKALALARYLAKELRLKILNPSEGAEYNPDDLPDDENW